MQRVSALLPSWDRSKPNNATSPTTAANTTSPLALGKVFGWAGKIAPSNRNSTGAGAASTAARDSAFAPLARYDRETYWPTTLDRECNKAARILKSFCIDGFLALESSSSTPPSPTEPTDGSSPATDPLYVMKQIPPRILQNALGLAVFSCMRSGLWMNGSGGAGLITARKADGTWSPPSGILLHTTALNFKMGVDIYDCVLIINSVPTLELFYTRAELTLGTDCSLTVGPLVDTSSPDPEMRWKGLEDTILTYVKSRGKHQHVPLDSSLVKERCLENQRFYGESVGVADILAGNIPKEIPEMRPLFEVIKAAEGRSDYDKGLLKLLAQQPAPGDAVLESSPDVSPTSSVPKTPFGIPDADDPDPFGVIGLEMAGIEIREAGTRMRPVSTQFEYNPSPTSPAFPRFSRQSVDTFNSRSNRGSYMSSGTQATAVTDAYTQTDVASTADTSFSRANSDDGREVDKLPTVMEPDEVDYTKIDTSMIQQFSPQVSEEEEDTAPPAAEPVKDKPADVADSLAVVDNSDKASSMYQAEEQDERDEDADDEDDEDEDLEDEAVIVEVATAAAPTRTSLRSSQLSQVIHAKAGIVNIPKRIPPPLPARSPARTSRASKSEFGSDVAGLKSPLRSSFMSVESVGSQAEENRASIEETADATPSETFATTMEDPVVETETVVATQEPEKALQEAQDPEQVVQETQEPEKKEVQGHRKNSSSVCTAVVAPEVEIVSDIPEVPAIPAPALEQPSKTADTASSPDESEHEPETPKTDAGFTSLDQKKPIVESIKDVALDAVATESHTITVA